MRFNDDWFVIILSYSLTITILECISIVFAVMLLLIYACSVKRVFSLNLSDKIFTVMYCYACCLFCDVVFVAHAHGM